MKFVKALSYIFFMQLSAASIAHGLYTSKNTSVSHHHYGVGCPEIIEDSYCEKLYPTLSPIERTKSATCEFNCHGRTFANRSAWVDFAEPYLTDDPGIEPKKPVYGDIVIFKGSNGVITHTVTIDGPWLGTSTMVKSKIGRCGEYRHALSKTIAIYKGNPYAPRRLANTVIYQNPSSNEDIADFLPNHKESMSNEEIYKTISQPWIDKTTAMNAKSKAALRKAKNLSEKVDVLIQDIIDRRHFDVLIAYDRPDASPSEFIQGLEATKELTKLSKLGRAEKVVIFQKISSRIESASKLADPQAAALIFAIENISTAEDSDLVFKLLKLPNLAVENKIGSYTNFYLKRLESKFSIAS